MAFSMVLGPNLLLVLLDMYLKLAKKGKKYPEKRRQLLLLFL
jgi:hypothetical protein